MTQSAGINRAHHHSLKQKRLFASLHFGIVIFCGWLVFFDGFSSLGLSFQFSDPDRAILLLAFATIYFLRHLLTLFYLLKRRITWSEATGLLVFFVVFEVGFLVLAGGVLRAAPAPFGAVDIIGILLFAFGSYLNSFSEMQRKWWKADPANKGHCYTLGLFGHAMHINFFGDMVLFTGWAMVTHSIYAFSIPALMTVMFIFMHIPPLDRYLEGRYGDEFRTYARKTKKLIPFIY